MGTEILKQLAGNDVNLLWNIIEQEQRIIAEQQIVINRLTAELKDSQDTAARMLDILVSARKSTKRDGASDEI